MADTKFSQFVVGGALQNNDIVVGLRSGLNTQFTVTPLATTANTVFVAQSPAGNDSTGNGSFSNPYATVAHAMTTITTATTTNPFNIVILGGYITETAQILLKPNIGIVGLDQQVNVVQASPMILDATYLNAASSYTNIANLLITGTINLDFSTATSLAGHVIVISGASIGNLSINGNSLVLPTITIDSVGMANLTINNCILLLYATTLNSFTGGNLPDTKQTVAIVVGNSFSGAIDLNSNNGGRNCNYFFRGNFVNNTVTITNNAAFWYVDTSSYVTPTIVSGGNIVLDSISNGLSANYTPVNYIPTAPSPTLTTSVNAHLRGIDNALSSISPDDNIVYVTPDGSDSTGDGTLGNPYATVGFAMTTITTATANSAYLIYVSEGTITETQQIILKPFVSIGSNTENIPIVMTSNLILHSAWGTTANGNSYLANLTFTGGNTNFDFSGFSNSTTQKIGLFNISTPNLVVNGNVNTNLQFNALSCITTSNAALDNVTANLNLCNFNSVTCGQQAIVRNSVMNFISCYLGTGAIALQGAAGGGITNQYSIRSCKNKASGLTITNPNCSLEIDVTSFIVPTIVNGAVLTLSSIANGLMANYTPINYTVSGVDVRSHLNGIDNALAGVTSPSTRYIYVSSTGSNVSGNGSFDNPYATVAFAMGTITTASAANPFTIYLIGGTIVETVQISLKPFVSISGVNNSVILQLSASIIFHSSWNTTVSPSLTLADFSFTNNDIILNGSAYTNASVALVFINNVNSLTRSLTIKGSANFDLQLYANNCIFNLVSYSNSLLQLNSCITQGVICNPSKADPSLRTASAFFLGGRLGAVIINSVASGSNVTASFYGNQIQSLTGDGAVVILSIDASSFISTLTISNSATYNLISKSSGLAGDYTPVNYTPTASSPILSSSLQGHLRGIDNALASTSNVSGVYSTSDPIVISTLGWTSFTLGWSFITRIENIVTITTIFTCNPSAITQSVQLQVPYTNPFPSPLLAAGTANLYLASGSTPANNGCVAIIKTNLGTRNIEIDTSVLVGNIGSNHNLQVVFSYQVQP